MTLEGERQGRPGTASAGSGKGPKRSAGLAQPLRTGALVVQARVAFPRWQGAPPAGRPVLP